MIDHFVLSDGTLEQYDYNGLLNKPPIVMPEMYGAKGDGATDDTQAINNALGNGNHVLFGNGKTYKVNGGLYIQDGQTIDLNGSTIVSSGASLFMNFHSSDVTYGYDGIGNFEIKNGTIYGGEMLFGHGKNIRVRDVNFRNSLGSHSMQIMSCKRVVIDNCSFIGVKPNADNGLAEPINLDPCVWEGFRGYGEGSLSYDGTNNYDITIQNCYFASGTDTGFVGLTNAIGGHFHVNTDLHHDCIKVINNTIVGTTYAGLRTFDFHNSIISGNSIVTEKYALAMGYGIGNTVTNNDFLTTSTSRPRAIFMYYGEEKLSLFSNTYRAFSHNYVSFNGKVCTFRKTDPVPICTVSAEMRTDITLEAPYNTFDTISACIGYASSNSVKYVEAKCYWGHRDGYEESNAFRIPSASGDADVYALNGVEGATVTLSLDDPNVITFDGCGVSTRFVFGSRGV